MKKIWNMPLKSLALFLLLCLPIFGQSRIFVLAQGTGTGSSGNATALQGVSISPSGPSSGQCLTFNGTVWIPGSCSGTSSFGFNQITSGTNATAVMVVGAGGSLTFASSGTINASSLLSGTWAIPGTIGSTTANTGAFTTISATGQIASTVSTGTSPFVVASTTVVGNLNASQLLGSTWASPPAIGSSAAAAGNFTTLLLTGALTTNVTGGGTQCLHVNNAGVVTGASADCGSGGGSGTVTTFTAGNFSPLFTTSVATATTTPALSFTISNAAQNSVLAGPASGGAGAYSFQTAPTFSAANLTNFPSTVQSGLIHTPLVYTGASTSTTAGPTPSCTPPGANGTYSLLFSVTASTTVDVSCPQVGLAGTSGLTGATATYTIAYSDNSQIVTHDYAGSAPIAVTLPTPTTLGNTEFAVSYCNYSTSIDTVTPTTWTINGNASISVPPKSCHRISVDPNNASLSKTNWLSICQGPGCQTLNPKIIDGVSISANYPGATLDVRVNAAMSDAENLANGNTSGIVDSSGEGGTQTIAAQITVGDGTHGVSWIIPTSCAWSATSAIGSTNYAIFQNSQTKILGSDASSYKCLLSNNAGNLGIEALMGNAGVVSNNGYYHARGIGLVSSFTTNSGAVWWVKGGLDVSDYENIGVNNNSATTFGLLINNGSAVCCAENFNKIELGSNSVGGTPLAIRSSGSGVAQRISFTNSSITHPVSGSPIVSINDTSTQHNCSVSFYNVYEETNQSTDNTTNSNQISGCGEVLVEGMTIDCFASSPCTGAGWTVDTTFDTYLDLDSFEMGRSYASGTCTFATDANTSETITGTVNSGGNTCRLNSYRNQTSYMRNLTVSGTLTVPPGTLFNQTIQNNGTPVAQEPVLNLIPGTDVTLGFTDTTGVSTNVTINASGSVGTAWSAVTAAANTQTAPFSTTAPWTFSAAGAASTPGVDITGTPFSGTGTTSTPQLYLNQGTAPTTWVTPGTEIGVNAASGFTGNFMDFHLNGGASLAFINSSGSFATTGVVQVGTAGTFGWASSSKWANLSNGTVEIENSSSSAGVVEASTFDSLVATGTAPLTIASTTVVPNLNVSQLLGGTWAIPGTIGSTTPNTGAFTTLSASSTVSGTGFSTYLASPPAIGGTAPAAGSFTTLGATGLATLSGGAAVGSSPPTCSSFSACFGTGGIQSLAYATTTNCASGASPAVCGSAPAGAVAIPTGANPTLVVNTSAVTANSRIILEVDDTDTISGTTCNSTLLTLVGGEAITARTAGTSFTISFNGTVTTNPVCVSYWIVN